MTGEADSVGKVEVVEQDLKKMSKDEQLVYMMQVRAQLWYKFKMSPNVLYILKMQSRSLSKVIHLNTIYSCFASIFQCDAHNPLSTLLTPPPLSSLSQPFQHSPELPELLSEFKEKLSEASEPLWSLLQLGKELINYSKM